MNKNKLSLILGVIMVFSMVSCTSVDESVNKQRMLFVEDTASAKDDIKKENFNSSEVSHFFEKTKEDVWNVFGMGNLEYTGETEFGIKSKVFSYPKSDNEEKTTSIAVNYETKKIHIINTKTNLFEHVRDLKVGDTAESVIDRFDGDIRNPLCKFYEGEDGYMVSLYGEVSEDDVLNPTADQTIGYIAYENSDSDSETNISTIKSIVYRDGGIEVAFSVEKGIVTSISYSDFR